MRVNSNVTCSPNSCHFFLSADNLCKQFVSLTLGPNCLTDNTVRQRVQDSKKSFRILYLRFLPEDKIFSQAI